MIEPVAVALGSVSRCRRIWVSSLITSRSFALAHAGANNFMIHRSGAFQFGLCEVL